MNISMFATKIGMTQVFINSERIPVSILEINPNIVLNKTFYEKQNKYTIQIGYQSVILSKTNRSVLGFFKKIAVKPLKYIKEYEVSPSFFKKVNVKDCLDIKNFDSYKYVQVSGISIGKGYAGVMKRHNFGGFPASHGTHEMFRHGGSIGCSAKPGKVFKGKKMAGHLGVQKICIKNLKIIKYIYNKNYLLIKGGCPGHKNSIIYIKGYNL